MKIIRNCPIAVIVLLAIILAPRPGPAMASDAIRFLSERSKTPDTGVVSVIDARRIWVGLTYTADGGGSWIAWRPPTTASADFDLGAPPTGALTWFITPERGWLTGTRSVWMTDNGGRAWRRQVPGHIHGLAFVGNSGWLSAGDGHIVQNYRTDDSGQNWQSCGSPWEKSKAAPRGYSSFIDPKTGWIIIASYDERELPSDMGVARTKDGGCSWEVSWRDRDRIADLAAIQFVDRSFGWLLESRGRLLETTDGGLHWRAVTVPATLFLEGAYLVSRTRGWIVGSPDPNSGLYYTDDGGRHWHAVSREDVRENVGMAREVPVNWGPGFLRIIHLRR